MTKSTKTYTPTVPCEGVVVHPTKRDTAKQCRREGVYLYKDKWYCFAHFKVARRVGDGDLGWSPSTNKE